MTSSGACCRTILRLHLTSLFQIHRRNVSTKIQLLHPTHYPTGVLFKFLYLSADTHRKYTSQVSTTIPPSHIRYFTSITEHIPEDYSYIDVLEDKKYEECFKEYFRIPGTGQRVVIIQPDDKTKSKRAKISSAELQLDEACALIDTLPNWKVIDKCIISTKHLPSKKVFGSGQMELIKGMISKSTAITCVFVGVNMLTTPQLIFLRKLLGVPVYDRYTIVLQIFKEHAKTKVAKLQVALAEVPYIRKKMDGLTSGTVTLLSGTVTPRVKPSHGESTKEAQHKLLQDREMTLKRAINQLAKQRRLLRESRKKSNLPTIAVVGYTNSGKTSLIKALTQDLTLEPKDQLFATLDVTVHQGVLPSKMPVLYIDTVGFITDIPTSLIEAFRATLEDALLADVIIHVRDISHPDTVAQKHNVLITLDRLLSQQQIDDIIEVNNKVDLLPSSSICNDSFPLSVVTGQGVAALQSQINQTVIKARGLQERRFKIPSNGDHLSWLYKESTILDVTAGHEVDFLIVKVLISDANYAKFKHTFFNALKT